MEPMVCSRTGTETLPLAGTYSVLSFEVDPLKPLQLWRDRVKRAVEEIGTEERDVRNRD